MTPLRQALDRTLLLMRDEVSEAAGDDVLLNALTQTEVALIADETNLISHSAQCAFVTAATLMARSGHRLYVVAPDVPLLGAQLPLAPRRLVSSLVDVGKDLLPGIEIAAHTPDHPVDLLVSFGDSPGELSANQHLAISAGNWSAMTSINGLDRWPNIEWPLGGIAAGTIAAAEALKVAMRTLRPYARNSAYFDDLFARVGDVVIELAPESTPRATNLGCFDIISGGAITHATLYCISRILGVAGGARIIDGDVTDLSNLNRYALLRRSHVPGTKVDRLAKTDFGALTLEPVEVCYRPETTSGVAPLARTTLVGVDHIPTRWEVQKAKPDWLGIGATTHWSAMASFHVPGLACAQCLHPTDDPGNAPIPTVAVVSFWAGLLLSAYFLRRATGENIGPRNQQTYMSPLRPERPWRSRVATRQDCPLRCVIPHDYQAVDRK